MDTKLSSNFSEEFEGIIEGVKKLEELGLRYISERDAWKARAEKAEGMLSWHNKFSTYPGVIAAAEEAGLSPEDWIAQKLQEAVSPVVDLPVNAVILELFQDRAEGLGLDLREFTTGSHVTQVLKALFEDMKI